jgi:hypothetical protein
MTYKPYGNNILIAPKSKNKVIGDTSKFYLFGEVLDTGNDVKNIQKGDTIGYTLWGLNKIVEEDGTEHFFVQDNPDFILGVIKNENKT